MTILVFGTVQPEALAELEAALRNAKLLQETSETIQADQVLDSLDIDMASEDYDAELERRLRELVADKTVVAAVCGYQMGEYLLNAWELARAITLAPRCYVTNLREESGRYWLECIEGDDPLPAYLQHQAATDVPL